MAHPRPDTDHEGTEPSPDALGLAPGPDSPPAITQSRTADSHCRMSSSPSSGSQLANLTAATDAAASLSSRSSVHFCVSTETPSHRLGKNRPSIAAIASGDGPYSATAFPTWSQNASSPSS